MSDSTAEAAEALSAEMADDAKMGDAESPAEPRRQRRHGHNEPRGPDYRPFVTRHDEIVTDDESGVLALDVEDLKAEAERLREAGVQVGVVVEIPGTIRLLDVFDPDGNRIQLTEQL